MMWNIMSRRKEWKWTDRKMKKSKKKYNIHENWMPKKVTCPEKDENMIKNVKRENTMKRENSWMRGKKKLYGENI